MAIPSDYNIQKKAIEKMSKYVNLQIECQRMWNKKVQVIPIIIAQREGIQSYLQRIPGNPLQPAKVSHPGNSTHPKEGTVNQARLKVTAQNNQPCEP